MDSSWSDPNWPPGTVRLETAKKAGEQKVKGKVILQPRPTADPNDPLNWPQWRKNMNFGLAAFFALMVFSQINATTPTWGPMGEELNFDDTLLNNTYAIGCATLALGGFMLMPFALKYGLRPVYVLCCAAQLGVMIWAARTETAGDWWGVNAVQCWLGSLGECLVQMTITDVFFVHERGLMNSIYIWSANLGSSLAPVAAGFATSSLGWRWVWWICAILFAVETVMMIFGFEESKFDWTKAEVVTGRVVETEGLQRTASANEKNVDEKTSPSAVLSAPESDPEIGTEEVTHLTSIEIDHTIPRKSYWKRLSLYTPTEGPWIIFARHAYQPFQIMFFIPGVAYVCMVYAILLSWGTVMSAALSTYMLDAPYNFNSTQIGLMGLAPFAGTTLGTLIGGPLSDWLVLKLASRNGGIYEPEMRLWALVPFIPFQVAGPFWFGYALEGGSPWISIAFAYGVCSFGQAPISSVTLTYMLDAYNEVVGDALVALTFSRNTLSTVFVFAMSPWIAKVGMSNVFNTIGAIGIAILLLVFVFIWKGKHWRYTSAKQYQKYAERQFHPRPIMEYSS